MKVEKAAITPTNPIVSKNCTQGVKAFKGRFLDIQIQQNLDEKLLTRMSIWHTFGNADHRLPETLKSPFYIGMSVRCDESLQLSGCGFRSVFDARPRKRIKGFLKGGDHLLPHGIEAVVLDGLEVNVVGSHRTTKYEDVKMRDHAGSLQRVWTAWCRCRFFFFKKKSRLEERK